MTPGTVASTVRVTRRTGRTRTGFGLRGLMWLMYRQYRVSVVVVGLIAAFAGLLFLIDDAPMMAGSTMMAVPIVVLFLLVQRKMAAGLTAGAVKG